MKTPMLAQIIGAVVNILLDPLLIFGMFGLPRLGIAGAAAATVTGQIAAALIVMKKDIGNLRQKRCIRIISEKFSGWACRIF